MSRHPEDARGLRCSGAGRNEETGRLIVDNLLQHILAEDTVYFELAESGFSDSELQQMGKEMHELELRLKETSLH